MSEQPHESGDSAVQRAAEVIARWTGDLTSDGEDMLIVEALAAAGLLADPTTPTLTPEQTDVIEAAKEVERVWSNTEDSIGPPLDALCDAVDRLAAATEEPS